MNFRRSIGRWTKLPEDRSGRDSVHGIDRDRLDPRPPVVGASRHEQRMQEGSKVGPFDNSDEWEQSLHPEVRTDIPVEEIVGFTAWIISLIRRKKRS